MLRFQSTWLLLIAISVTSAGCCCVQGVSSCDSVGLGAAGCGPCGAGPLARLASCRGACGDVYVDEWISEPPVVDNCGGCGSCQQCRPVRTLLRVLWGRPFIADCCASVCGPSCDSGCSTCGGGGMHDSYMPGSLTPVPTSPASPMDAVPDAPEPVPAPAPTVAPTSAKRLNPAARHRSRSRAH